eukprot:TRINITY_DN991_c0_g1_i1.p1 TRINITY_DN991_c0_g1~~TRINITY_DN991_c0_g1_i1.p1  ORF type:complete len:227 (-),score=76.98 TRINITY_DN991_c0_g1_i1:86-766(-)
MGNNSSQVNVQELKGKYKIGEDEIQKLLTEWKSTTSKTEMDKKRFGELVEKIGFLDNINKISAERGVPASVLKAAAVDELFIIFDEDKSGKVSFEELLFGVSLVRNGSELDHYQAVFNWRDKNGDGTLDRSELCSSVEHTIRVAKKIIESSLAFYEKKGEMDKVSKIKQTLTIWSDKNYVKNFVDQMFQAADIDKDGKISFEEFKQFVSKDPSWTEIFQHIKGAQY